MVGSGWNISNIENINISDPSRGELIQAVCLRMIKGNERELVLYWYYERGRIITSEYHKKFFLLLDALTRKRTDGALIRLISRVSGSEKATLEKMTQFASELFPILKGHIPA
jgi:EpsI family protein